jgi:hypothetical protein
LRSVIYLNVLSGGESAIISNHLKDFFGLHLMTGLHHSGGAFLEGSDKTGDQKSAGSYDVYAV